MSDSSAEMPAISRLYDQRGAAALAQRKERSGYFCICTLHFTKSVYSLESIICQYISENYKRFIFWLLIYGKI